MMGNPLTDYENLRDMKERVPGKAGFCPKKLSKKFPELLPF